MVINLGMNWENFYKDNIVEYIKSLQTNPFELVTLIIDITIVIFLMYCFFKIVRGSRAWQLIKGIALLIIATWMSGLFNLKILNWILTGIMNLGVIAIIVIFQPELRRALEQLGTNKLTQFFGIDKDLSTKTKEDIYKVVIAATELSKAKTGALIVLERDIKIQDIKNLQSQTINYQNQLFTIDEVVVNKNLEEFTLKNLALNANIKCKFNQLAQIQSLVHK